MSTVENISQVMMLLKGLSQEQQEYLNRYLRNIPRWALESMQVMRKGKDTLLIEENAPADMVYLLASGVVRAIDYRLRDVAYDYMWFYPTKVFGAMEIFLNYPSYLTTLKTVTPCLFLTISRTNYEKWIWQDNNALKMEFESMGRYLFEQNRVGRAYLFLQGMDRILFLFMHSYEQQRTEGDLVMSITRMEIAERSGISVKTANRAMKKIEEEQFVGRSRKKIIVTRAQYERIRDYLLPFIGKP